jgi:hypothetical protein
MSEIAIAAAAWAEDGMLRLFVWASAGGFSGAAEIFVTRQVIADFASALAAFPTAIGNAATLEYGDESGDFPAHLMLRAHLLDRVGHSAMRVRFAALANDRDSAHAEFFVLSEIAGINELGRKGARPCPFG